MRIIVNNIRVIALFIVTVFVIGNVNMCACASAEAQAHSSVIYFQDFENDAIASDGWSFTPVADSESYAQISTDEQGGGMALKIVSKNTSIHYQDVLKFDFGDVALPDKGKIEIIFEYRVESLTRDFAKFGAIKDINNNSNLFFRSSSTYALWKGAWASNFQFTNQYHSLKYILDLDDGEYEIYRNGTLFAEGTIDDVAKPSELRFESCVKNATDTNYSADKADMVYWIDNVCVRKIPMFNAMLYDEDGMAVGNISNKQGQTFRATVKVDLNKYPNLPEYTGVLALKSDGKLEKIRIIPSNEFNNGVAFEDFVIPSSQTDDIAIEAYLWNGLDGLMPLETSVTLGNQPLEKLEFFISETGKANATGTIDDPFCNIQQALEAIRRIKNRDAYPQGGITVTIRSGSYANPDGISLTDVHSGEPSAPVIWRAYPGEEVSIHGSDVLDSSAFTVSDDPRIDESAIGKVYVCKLADIGVTGYTQLPAVGLGAYFLSLAGWGSLGYPLNGYFPLLTFDGEPLTIARYPNKEDGYATLGTGNVSGSYSATVEDSTAEKIGMQISAKNIDDDRLLRWKNAAEAGDLWAFGLWYHDWSDLTTPITAIDTDTKMMQAALDSSSGIRAGQRYYVYNLLEELDAPGEWFYDRKTDQLFVYPPEGKTIKDAVIHAAFTGNNLFTMNGTKNTIIADLIFEDTNKHAIQIKSGNNILVENCIMRNASGSGAEISGTDITVNGCTIEHIGRRGITFSGGDLTNLTPSGNLLSNTEIRDFGRDYKMMQPGIFVSGVGQTIRNNLIENGPQLGICFGGNDHLIEYNLVRDVMKLSGDGGAIYAGQDVTGRGTVIRKNIIRDIANEKDRWVYGIYLDGRFCGTTITENVLSNIGDVENDKSAIFVNGGRNNTITHNLIVNAGVGVHYSGVVGDVNIEDDVTNNASLQAVLTNPSYAKYPNLQDMPSDDPLEPKYGIVQDNLVFNVSKGLSVSPGHRPVSVEWMRENNTLVEPITVTEEIGFNDVSTGDYTLKDISAAYEWIPEFRSVRSSEVGPRVIK